MLESPRYAGAIRWDGAGQPSKSAEIPGRYQQYGRLTNSYLAGSGTLLSADLRHRALQVRNCVLVSLDNLFALDIAGPGSDIAAAVDLQNSTLSAGETFFSIQSGSGGRPAAPLRFFVDRTVFAPPVESKTNRAVTLLSYDGLAREQRHFDWWEEANGYAGELTSSDARQSFAETWQKAWGTAQVLRPLADRGDVLLKSPLPPRTKLGPGDFALSPSSNAAKWTADGQAIGAAVETLPTGEATAASRKTGAKKKERTTPDF
jgi:hypothetical protein